ncbi:MAG TPA: rhomboid family intramembrane serine protease [Thermodesulfobacteriota bacterium]|jgi:membrane associated rhomboid family serine protease|nr:rhomboid family intramembrane serine protease [Thermodesulfobacteriota bacterium]
MTYYRYRFSFGYGLTPVIKNLMIIMGAVFLVQMLVRGWIELYFGLVPILVWKKYFLWQLVTYMFLHGGFFHILFNLLAFWMFGGELENYWGSKKFLFYFLFCGIGAGICTVVVTPYQFIPVIGASGAIYGILLAFGWLFPNRLIYVYFLFPIPAKYFVIIFGLIEFFSSIGGAGGGVSHLTHLGGLLFGLLYMLYPMVRQKIRREHYKRKWSQRGPNSRDYYH